jgi:predicted DNA-binding transcriptional regulator AlpA
MIRNMDEIAPQPSSPQAKVQLLVDARQAAVLLGISVRTLRAMDSAGKLPAPIRLSPGCVRWRTAELRDWTEAGCPDRETWAAMRAAQK